MVQKRINQRAVNCYKRTGFIQENMREKHFLIKMRYGAGYICAIEERFSMELYSAYEMKKV